MGPSHILTCSICQVGWCVYLFLRSRISLTSFQALTTILLHESRQDSKWAPYLSILPHQLDNLVFWSDEELAELQGSKVVNKIGKSSAKEAFSKTIVPLGLATSEECHRVASIIMSYAFDIPETNTEEDGKDEDQGEDLVSDDGEDEKTILSMIPLADMLCVYPEQLVFMAPFKYGVEENATRPHFCPIPR